jgi:hypothetical protein
MVILWGQVAITEVGANIRGREAATGRGVGPAQGIDSPIKDCTNGVAWRLSARFSAQNGRFKKQPMPRANQRSSRGSRIQQFKSSRPNNH